MELTLLRTPQGFIPANDAEAEKCRKVKFGATVRADIAQMRNAAFHRKWFALVKIAFDVWSETMPTQEYKGEHVLADFDRFRKDVTILAGHYRPVFNARGECRLEADSIAFGNMDEETFEKLFSKTIDVILKSILPNSAYDEQTLRALADEVVRFA